MSVSTFPDTPRVLSPIRSATSLGVTPPEMQGGERGGKLQQSQLGKRAVGQHPVGVPCGPLLAVMNMSFHYSLNVSYFAPSLSPGSPANLGFSAKAVRKKSGCSEKYQPPTERLEGKAVGEERRAGWDHQGRKNGDDSADGCGSLPGKLPFVSCRKKVASESLSWFSWTCVVMRMPSIHLQPRELSGHGTCYCKCSAT